MTFTKHCFLSYHLSNHTFRMLFFCFNATVNVTINFDPSISKKSQSRIHLSVREQNRVLQKVHELMYSKLVKFTRKLRCANAKLCSVV